MAMYEVKSGKHHVPSVKNKRVVLETYKPGDRFSAEKWEVKNIKDKLTEVKEEKRVSEEKVLNEKIKGKFKREKYASV